MNTTVPSHRQIMNAPKQLDNYLTQLEAHLQLVINKAEALEVQNKALNDRIIKLEQSR